jgi:methionine-rich copper-binding protein CopC
MTLARVAIERLLLLFFTAMRAVFLMQGLAFAVASLSVLAASSAGAPAWLRGPLLLVLLVSVILFVAGVGLVAVRRRWAIGTGAAPDAPAWPALLALSLVALPALAAHAASGLLPLWGEVGARLEAIGFWEGVAQPGPFGGIVILPILLALSVPGLLSAAALVSIGIPLALLPLLATRSPLFPTLLAMGAVCQTALVLAGVLATEAFGRLTEPLLAAMAASGDAEVLQVNDWVRGATHVLRSTATALVTPMLGVLAWTVFLRPAAPAAAWFARGTITEPILSHAATTWAPAGRAFPQGPTPAPAPPPTSARPPAPPRVPPRRAQAAVLLLGSFMLCCAALDTLRTRTAYESSEPSPGATLAAPPARIRLRFAAALDPDSSLRVTRLGTGDGEIARPVEVASRLAPDDPQRRTLEAAPALAPGLYHVSWSALPAGGGVTRHGSFSFGVGVPVPADGAGVAHSLVERDSGARGRRHTWAGAVILLAFGALLPRLPRR